MKKLTAILLALVMLMSVALVACDNGAGVTGTEGGGRTDPDDPLPSDLVFTGKQITVLYSDSSEGDVIGLNPFTEKLEGGNKLNEQIYNRENITEERLGIKINPLMVDDVMADLTLNVQANLDEYQLVNPTCYSAGMEQYLTENLFLNLLNKERFPYLNTGASYYFAKFNDEATYKDALYFVAGDLSLDLVGSMYATFFNKTLAEDIGYKDTDLYNLVRNGQWTIDKQLEISAAAYKDVTGNGKTDDDIFGMNIGNLISLDAYLAGFDMEFVDKSGDTLTYVFESDRERHYAICTKVFGMLNDRTDILVYDDYDNSPERWERLRTKFAEEETLFTTLLLNHMSSKAIRDMKSDYGVLPTPMFDETQSGYYTQSEGTFKVWAIPSTTIETELASAVLEYLSYYSDKYVAPTYYDDLLNGQYTRDLDTSEMLDTITDNFKIDFGVIYNYSLNKISQNAFRYMLNEQKTDNINRYWAQNKKMYNKKLETFNATWNKLKELGA